MLLFQEIETKTISSVEKPIFSIDNLTMERGNPEDLLTGFTELKAVSYSSSPKQVVQLVLEKGFKNVEFVIGLSEDFREITELLSSLQEGVLELLFEDITLNIYQVPNTHSKIYLLYGEGKKRVILGSANFSLPAWTGQQNEVFLYSDNPAVVESFEEEYERIKGGAKPLLEEERIKKEKETLKRILHIENNVENLTIEEMNDETFRKLQESVNNIQNIFISNLIVNLPSSVKTDIEKRKQELEKENSTIENINALLEHKKEILLEKEKAIPKILSKQNTEDEIPTSIPFAIKHKHGEGFLINSVAEVKPPSKDQIKEQMEALSHIFETVGNSNPEITPYMIEAVMYSFAGSYLWYLRQDSKIDPVSLPIFGLLGGESQAGKTLTLTLIRKMTRGVFFEHDSLKRKTTQVLEGYFLSDVYGFNPLLIDEIKKQHLSSSRSSSLYAKVKSYTNELKKGQYGVFIGAFNLEKSDIPLEIYRRVFFIPFRKPLNEEKIKANLKKSFPKIDWFLYLLFLASLKLYTVENDTVIEVNGKKYTGLQLIDDPILPVRDFFKRLVKEFEVNLPVSDSYLGGFRKFMLEKWRLFYLTEKDRFQPFVYKSKNGNEIEAFKVEAEKGLVVLPEFSLAKTENYLIIDKKGFLKAIGEKATTGQTLTRIWKKLFK